jgi:hypothetical protein
VANDTRWSWYTDELAGKPVQLMTGRLDGFVFESNNLFNLQAPELYLITYGSRTSSNPPQHAVSWWELNHPGLFKGNLESDPQFVDAANHDYHLRLESPMIDAGGFLTTTTGRGSGISMPVADAGYFYDGYGITDEKGDVIQLSGQTETARVIGIDYGNKRLILDKALSWSDKQGVALQYSGNGPDVGAFEYIIPPAGIEAWRIFKFGGDAANPAIAGDFADPDGDGVNNLLEYGLHGDPKVADTSVLPKLGTEEKGLSIVFQRDETLSDLTYAVQATDTLMSASSWVTIARASGGTSFVALLPGVKILEAGAGPLKTVTVCDAATTSESGCRFLRLQISR